MATNDFTPRYNPLKIDPDAAVTVIIYRLIPDREVNANFAFRPGELRARSVAAITAEVKKQLTADASSD